MVTIEAEEAEAPRSLYLQYLAQRFIEIQQEKGSRPTKGWHGDVADASFLKHALGHEVQALGERGTRLRHECSAIFLKHVKRLERVKQKSEHLPRQDYNPFSFVQPSLTLRVLLNIRAASSLPSTQHQCSTFVDPKPPSTTIPSKPKRPPTMSSHQAEYEKALEHNNIYALNFEHAGRNTNGVFAVTQEKVLARGQSTYINVATILVRLNHPSEVLVSNPRMKTDFTGLHVDRPSIDSLIQSDPEQFMQSLSYCVKRDVVLDFDTYLQQSSPGTKTSARIGNHSFGVGGSNDLLSIATDTYLLPPHVTGKCKRSSVELLSL